MMLLQIAKINSSGTIMPLWQWQSLARSLVRYLGNEELGLSCREMGAQLNISQQAVSKWIAKGRAHCITKRTRLEDFGG